MNAARRTGQNLHTTCYKTPMRRHDYAPRPAHVKWLLDSDPAIRWQVMMDLTGEAPNAIAAERSRVATEGPQVEKRFAEGGPRLAYYTLQSRGLDGPRSRPLL